MKKNKSIRAVHTGGIAGFIAIILFQGIAFSQSLPPGIWKGALTRPDGKEIVFNFQTRDSNGRSVIYVYNADERLLVDSIRHEGDSLFIQMPFFNSAFALAIAPGGEQWKGVWIKNPGLRQQTIPFVAIHNQDKRFAITSPPAANIAGRWSAEFTSRNRTISRIGEFIQEGSRLTGTFLDPTGDLRFLEGVVDGDSLKLSAFDGSHALLITGKIEDGNTISGGWIFSGANSRDQWKAVRNDDAILPDEFSATRINEDAGKLNFRFREMTDGRWISIQDKRFQNKVLVITIMGSWCPNCMDETRFLSEYYDKNRNKGVEVIALAYEVSEDFEAARQALQPFKQRFAVRYPILITGVTVADSLRAEKTIPQIDKIRAFPTTLFVDKKGNIRKVHSGFDGPATGPHHERFKKEFNAIVDDLLEEP